MLAHTSELVFLQPKFTMPLKQTAAMCSTGATLNTPGFYFFFIFQWLGDFFAVYLLPQE